jgi:hypothetical protein
MYQRMRNFMCQVRTSVGLGGRGTAGAGGGADADGGADDALGGGTLVEAGDGGVGAEGGGTEVEATTGDRADGGGVEGVWLILILCASGISDAVDAVEIGETSRIGD